MDVQDLHALDDAIPGCPVAAELDGQRLTASRLSASVDEQLAQS